MRNVIKWIRNHEEELMLFVALDCGIGMVLDSWFSLSLTHAFLIAAPVAVALVAAFVWFARRSSDKQNTPLKVVQHSDFGEVRVFQDRWEAKVNIHPFPHQIEFCGETSGAELPSKAQIAQFLEIRQRSDKLVAAALLSLSEELKMVEPHVRPDELALTSIWLGDETAPTDFSMNFDVPTRKDEMPDGLYADFSDFKIVEAGWVH